VTTDDPLLAARPSFRRAGGQKRVELVATDLDGTLLRSDNTVSTATREALDAAQRAGLQVVFVTGRPTRWLWEVADAAGYTGVVVAANGAVTFDLASRTVLHSDELDPSTLESVTGVLRDSFPDVYFAADFGEDFAFEHGYTHDWEITTIRDRDGNPMPIPQAAKLAEIVAKPAVKLLAKVRGAHPDEFLAAAAEVIGDTAYVTRSATSGLLEISASGVSKATGLARHCDAAGITSDHVAAVGDMPNDIPMLRWAGRSYAVANAHPATQAAAERVLAETNDEDAVALLVRSLIAERSL
jgi:Cof subfamily protein (haloacid dehalogenase superfamily)